MYAIARTELDMSPGKLAAQCGHAFVDAYGRSPPDRKALYQSDGHGTKVVLSGTLQGLLEIEEQCIIRNIPCIRIIDSGHVLPPHFTGEPIITALGIGPSYRHEVKFLRSLPLTS